MMTNTPEINTTPPDEQYVMADCGHEVYSGEDIFTTTIGKIRTYCPDCMSDMLKTLSPREKAMMLGMDYERVS